MELANLRTKKKEELSTEETAFLAEHKTELTAEEQINLGLTEAPAPVTPTQVVEQATEEPAPVVDAELAALTADIKSGKKVLVEKAEYDGLKASAQKSESKLAEMEKKEIEGRVDAHIARGAIKADMKEKYAGLIQADASNEELLTSLPDNPLLASEVGAAGDAGVTALEQLRGKANEILKASTEAGAQSDIGKAMSQARKENPDLAKEADAEMQGKKN